MLRARSSANCGKSHKKKKKKINQSINSSTKKKIINENKQERETRRHLTPLKFFQKITEREREREREKKRKKKKEKKFVKGKKNTTQITTAGGDATTHKTYVSLC